MRRLSLFPSPLKPRTLLKPLAAAALLAAPLVGAAADPVPAAKRLPPVTYGFVSVPDVATAKERFDATNSAGLFTDPAFAELREMIAEQVEQGGEELRARLGLSLEELLAVPSGEVTFAVVQTAPREVAVVGLLDYGTSEDTVSSLIEQAEDALDENGLTRSVEPFEGTDVVVWTAPEDEVDEFAEDYDSEVDRQEPQRFGYFLKDTHLVVASDPAALEAVLVRWDGTHGSTFADNEVFGYIADRTKSDGREPVLVWYADVIGSVRAAVLGTGQGGLPVQMALSYLPVLGLDEFKAVGGSMDLATEEFAGVGKVVLYADRTDRALGLFTFPPAVTAPPAWVGDDAASYTAVNWDLAGAYDAVRTTYDSMIGPGEFDRAVSGQSDRLPVDVKAEIVDAFTGKVEVVGYPFEDGELTETLQSETPTAPNQPVVIALGLNDPRGVTELIELGMDQSGGRVTSRDFQGTPVYELAIPPTGQSFAAAVVGNTLLFSPEVTRVEAAIRGAADRPLSEAPTFRTAVSKAPAAVSILTFSDQRGQVQTFYNLFRSGDLTAAMDGEAREVLSSIADALPPFDQVETYLGYSAGYLVPDEHGALWVSYSLEPEDKAESR